MKYHSKKSLFANFLCSLKKSYEGMLLFFLSVFSSILDASGQTQVEALLKEVFSLHFVRAGHSESSEHRFQILNGTTTILHTAVIRKGQKMPDGSMEG